MCKRISSIVSKNGNLISEGDTIKPLGCKLHKVKIIDNVFKAVLVEDESYISDLDFFKSEIEIILISEQPEEEKQALMDYGNGNHTWLPVVVREDKNDDEYIVFCRDKESHVHAWHCNSLPMDDSRILEIKASA